MSETLRELDLKMKGYYNNNNINSPNESMLMRYLRSGTPSDHDFSPSPNHSRPIVKPHKSGSIKSSSSSKSPLSTVKSLEDDVLVMDGILVDSNKASKSSGKFRSSATSDSSSNSGANLYKTEICVSWENTGSCRYGYKCQFAHGKEELRPFPNRGRSKIKSDYVIVDPYYSPQSSTSSNSSKLAADTMSPSSSGAKEAAIAKFSKLEIQQKKDGPTLSPKVTTYSDSRKLATDTMYTSSSAAKEAAISKFNKLEIQQQKDALSLSHKVTSTDWSPLDDGIIPSSSDETFSRKAVDDYINRVLHGPALKNRLPVFVDICPQ